jgi:hypothetical protein
MARSQRAPGRKTTVGKRLEAIMRSSVPGPRGQNSVRFRDIIETLSTLLASPTFAGFLSMLSRCCPYESFEEIEAELEQGIRKEISASVEVYHPVVLDWSSIFSPLDRYRDVPLAQGYPVSTELNSQIHSCLCDARSKIRGKVLFPNISHETVGIEARENIRRMGDIIDRDPSKPEFSLWDCEKIYHRYGIEVSGRTEIRWSWKFNDLKPRIYFAKGPDQHYSSRYIQEILNIFVDCLPVTHRFLRFFIQSVQGSPEEYAFIYDYACFTSYLEEVRSFTSSLADFCKGVQVTIVDLRQGPRTIDLGEMIHEFNDKCNDSPEFDARRIFDMSSEEVLKLRHTCGMLGVPGNISTCTLLHGIHLAIIVGSLVKLKVVGDDAAGWMAFLRMRKRELQDLLGNIGKISRPKMEFWETEELGSELIDTTWNYVKRPIDRLNNRLVQGRQPIWPAVPVLLSEQDGFHTTSGNLTENDRYKKFSSQMLSFVLQFETFELAEEEVEFIDKFVRRMNRIMEIDKYETKVGKSFVRPHCFSGSEVRSFLKETFWRRIIQIPEPVTDPRDIIDVRGMEYTGTMSKALKIAVELGYAESYPRFISILPCYSEELFDQYLSRLIRQNYDIKVHRRCPIWLFDLIKLSNTLHTDDDDTPDW